MLSYKALIPKLDQSVENILKQQVIDKSRADYGGFIGPDALANPSSVGSASSLGYAYLLEESRYFHSQELLERIMMAAAFGRKWRRPSGCFDLFITNFDSAPDNAFLLSFLAPMVREAQRVADEDAGAARIAEELGELMHTGVPGMIKGGIHTPNHRWILISALAQTGRLFPDLEVVPTIDAYLQEGIDANADGEYIERSTGVYNAVVNRSLRFVAEILDRPELLEPVRRNLDLSYHLMHGDGTVVTSISRRQDRGEKVVPTCLADGYYGLGRMDGNGFYLAVTDWLCEQGGVGLECLPLFVEHPEWRQDDVEREELPDSYAEVYPTSGLWRGRRGQVSATAAAGLTAPFSVKYGNAELTAVKMSNTYFATGQFEGEDFEVVDGGIRMRHLGRNKIYPEKDYLGGIYWLPIDEKVTAENWAEVRGRRGTYEVPPLEVELKIVEVEGGFDLHIKSLGGLDPVPFQIECVFAPGGELETDSAVVEGKVGNTVFLREGRAVYRVGSDAISIGPGEARHLMWQMRNSEPSPEGFRVLITSMTPIDRVLEIRCGDWSWGEGDIV